MKTITSILLMVWAILVSAQTPVWHLKYDEANGTTTTREEISGSNLAITNQFGKPERVTGVTGNALRTDGFSTWIATSENLPVTTDMTLETWIVLESYPSDEELPYENLTPSAIISQYDGTNGFSLSINTFGVWYFTANINGQKYTCEAPQKFPLYEWTHVAASINGSAGNMSLYLNGQEVASISTPSGGTINKASVPLIIGKSNLDKNVGIFLVNALNCTYDETRIYSSSLGSSTISSHHSNESGLISTTGEQAITVTPLRFSHDLQRPAYHGLPPANWTNEPHGLVAFNGNYHMFYQRTPNGPFKFQMHWGHMVSADFVHWTNTRDALWPEVGVPGWSSTTGYDMKGIWSGDVVVDNGVAHAFYTCVNHSGPYNPGIARATSSDADLKFWSKAGPVIDRQFVNDFRDPYLFKDGNTWYMLIGAALSGSGGLDCYTSTDLVNWNHKSDFCTVPYGDMDIGSVIWEMPVFEPLGNGKYILEVNPIGGTVAKYGPKYTRGVYWIGTFSNGRFTPDYIQPKNLDVIHGHLSPTVTRNSNNQLVGIGMVDERRSSQAQKDAGWCHVFSLPRVWSLLPDNQTLGQAPAPELTSLRVSGSQKTFSNVGVGSPVALSGASGAGVEIIATVASTSADRYGLNLRVSGDRQEITRLYYDAGTQKIVLDKSASTLSGHDEEKVLLSGDYDEAAFGKPDKFHIFLDNSIIDVFINDKAAFSVRIYPTKADSQGIELFSEGANTTFTSVDVWTTSFDAGPVAVTGVSLNKTSTSISIGNTETLVATVEPFNATNQSVTWASGNTSVATVNSSGTVTAISEGTATITVTTDDGGKTASCEVTVIPAPEYEVYDFESGNLDGWTIVSGNAFSVGDVTSDPDWGWGGPFNHHGTYHLWGFKEGGDEQTGEMRTANFIPGSDGIIKLLIGGGNNIDNLYLGLYRASDNTLLLRETGSDDEGYTEKAIDASEYIGVECYLKAVDNETGGWGHLNLDHIRIPVSSHVSVTGVSLNKSSTTLAVGATETLTATISPSNATNQNVNWSSANTTVASVNSSGVVTANAAGTATMTVTTEDGGYQASCEVTVEDAGQYRVYDFESGNLDGWTVVSGDAFTNGDVTADTDWGWGGPFNHEGTYHMWGAKNGGDSRIGEMRTQPFVLGGDGVINFLIGGGFDINQVYLVLVRASDGAELLKATGDDNDSEAYVQKQFNASAHIGTECYLKAVDNNTGGWGHINLDNIVIPVQEYQVYDFESGNLDGWIVISGNAFTNGDVTADTDWGWGGPFNQKGTYHMWGAKNGGDSRTGEMRTQPFVLGGDGVIKFLIGGGFDINQVYLALVRASDGAELLKATGDDNDSEAYVQKQFNASAHIGTECYLKAVDNHTGGWGHINLDFIRIPVNDGSSARTASLDVQKAEEERKLVRLYPNPVFDQLHFKLNDQEEYQVTMLALDGRKVLEKSLNNSTSIDVTGLRPGMYLVLIETQNSKKEFRIIKQ